MAQALSDSHPGTARQRRAGSGPAPPKFATVEEERLHRKQRLAGALRLFGRFGFSEGVAGHITARDPELTDHFWVNPFGMSFRHVRVSDLILVSHTGEVVEGDRPVNPAAFAIHSAVHAARPDVIAAAHAHSIYGKAWSALGRPLDPITQDACVFYEDHTVCEEGGGAIVLEEAAAKALAAALGPHKATIHRNHGLSPSGTRSTRRPGGSSPWSAPARPSCWPRRPGHRCSSTTRGRVPRDNSAGHAAGWFSFQPLWDEISRSEPDFSSNRQ